jgi:hypothetical protein
MLARLARGLPVGGYACEPRWHGSRCLALAEATPAAEVGGAREVPGGAP